MSLFAEILSSFIRKNSKINDIRSKYIFYKIVDSIDEDKFSLQCINTSALFYATIVDIVFDLNILQGLHPIQSCFIGIEYAKHIKKDETNLKTMQAKNQIINQGHLSRYGCYTLRYQNRNSELCFVNNITNEQFIMDPRDIALSEQLISEFDAIQAFYIGLFAGLKIINPDKQNGVSSEKKQPNLYLVK